MLDENPHFVFINQAFPHIGKKLQTFWGYPEFALYMSSLLQDTRNGSRKGFPFDVLMALNGLSEEHEKEFPQLTTQTDTWSSSKRF